MIPGSIFGWPAPSEMLRLAADQHEWDEMAYPDPLYGNCLYATEWPGRGPQSGFKVLADVLTYNLETTEKALGKTFARRWFFCYPRDEGGFMAGWRAW